MKYLDLGNDLRTDAGSDQLAEGPLGITARKNDTGITWYTRMPDGTILNSRKGATTQNYFTEPHNKSVAALYSPTGARTAAYVYSPYGETTIHTSGSGVAEDNPFRYVSGFQDTAGAEDYYKLGARYYDGHGHFTQPDPVSGSVADPRTMTAYNYAGADPINRSDATGLWSWCRTWGGKPANCKAQLDAYLGEKFTSYALSCLSLGGLFSFLGPVFETGILFVFRTAIIATGPVTWTIFGVGCAAGIGIRHVVGPGSPPFIPRM